MADPIANTYFTPEDQAKLDAAVGSMAQTDASLATVIGSHSTDTPIPPPPPPDPVSADASWSSGWGRYIFWGVIILLFFWGTAIVNNMARHGPAGSPVVSDNQPGTGTSTPEPRHTSTASVRQAKKYYLLINKTDGGVELRTGGTTAWRDNNPGNLLNGPFTIKEGAIGADENNLAVFPTDKVGHQALYDFLFTASLKDKSISEAMQVYAPSKKGYDPDSYAKTVSEAVGVSADTKLSAIPEAKRDIVLATLTHLDTYIEGKVKEFKNDADFQQHGVQ